MDTSDDQLAFEDGSIREFRDAVTAAASEEIEVQPLEGGFKVYYRETLPTYGTVQRFSSTFLLVVQCDPLERVYTMEDQGMLQFSEVRSLSFGRSASRGRMLMTQTVAVMEQGEGGSFEQVESARQSTRVLHAAVREPSAALGWTEKQPLSAKIGKTVAIVTGVGMVIAAVVVGVLALSGYFS